MTELKQYENGYSPSALQRKYGLSYEQGYELAQDFKRLQGQLRIAIKALKKMAKDNFQCAEQALEEIELREVK